MAIRLLRQDDHQGDEVSKTQVAAENVGAEASEQHAVQPEVAFKRTRVGQSGGYEQWLEDVEDEGLMLLIDDEIVGTVSGESSFVDARYTHNHFSDAGKGGTGTAIPHGETTRNEAEARWQARRRFG
jgi:hypothetical protein